MQDGEWETSAGGAGVELCQLQEGPPHSAPPVLPPPPRSDSATLGSQEKEKLTMLERRYHSLTGGRPFPKTTSTLKEVTWLGQP